MCGRRCVGRHSGCGTGEKLPQIHHATRDVATDVVLIPPLKIGRSGHVPGENQMAKPRCKSLHLCLNRLSHVHRRTVGDLTVGPAGLFARRSARRIKQALLGDQQKRPLGTAAVPRRTFGSGDFGQIPADMNRPRAGTLG